MVRFLPEVEQRGLNNVSPKNPGGTSLWKRIGQLTPSLSSLADREDAEEALQFPVAGSSSRGVCPSALLYGQALDVMCSSGHCLLAH